jgi:hypothetical protein
MGMGMGMEHRMTSLMDDVRAATSLTAGLIMNKLEMLYPNDQKLHFARKAVLGALGDRGLNVDLRRILASHGMDGLDNGDNSDTKMP